MMKPQLLSIVWHITNRCNLDCSYCFTDSVAKVMDLPTLQMLDIVEQVNSLPVQHISLIGGEPFVRDDLHEIITALREDILINIDTHGLFIPSRWHKDYEARLNHVSVSVDGPEQIHNLQRRGYKQVIEAIDYMINRGIKVFTTLTVTKDSIAFVKETVDFLIKRGVSQVTVGQVKKLGRASLIPSSKNIFLTQEDHLTMVNTMKDLRQKYDSTQLKFYSWYSKVFFNDLNGEMPPSCLCGFARATIKHDGSVVPCESLAYPPLDVEYSFELPNLNKQKLENIFEDSYLFSYYRSATTDFLPHKCSSCPFQSRCNHTCRTEALFETGDILGVSSSCQVG